MSADFKADQTDKSTVFAAIPDPWYLAAQSAEPLIPAPWRFPLDPGHELAGKPIPASITGTGPVGDALLTVGKLSEAQAVSFLLQEELKLAVGPGDHLRDEIRDAIAYLELLEVQSA
jgi:hypothetical protein